MRKNCAYWDSNFELLNFRFKTSITDEPFEVSVQKIFVLYEINVSKKQSITKPLAFFKITCTYWKFLLIFYFLNFFFIVSKKTSKKPQISYYCCDLPVYITLDVFQKLIRALNRSWLIEKMRNPIIWNRLILQSRVLIGC
jgi:hypothetical protein